MKKVMLLFAAFVFAATALAIPSEVPYEMIPSPKDVYRDIKFHVTDVRSSIPEMNRNVESEGYYLIMKAERHLCFGPITTEPLLKSHLPFYGRTYRYSDYGTTSSGIDMDSHEFSYDAKKKKNGEVIVKVKNLAKDSNNEKITITISADEKNASLVISQPGRESITFLGYVEYTRVRPYGSW